MFFISLVILVSLFSSYLIQKKKIGLAKLVVIFNIMWIILSIILMVNLNNKMLVNFDLLYVYMSILVLIVSMNLGFFLFLPVESKTEAYNEYSSEEDMLSARKFFFINLIIFILLITILDKSIQYVLNGDLDAIRISMYYAKVGTESSLFSSGIETILVNWILNGTILGINIVVITSYFKKKCGLSLVLFSIFNGVVFAILTGGRIMILKIIIIIFLSMFSINSYKVMRIDHKKRDVFFKIKRNKLFDLLILLVVLAIFITIGRSTSDIVEIRNIFNIMSNYLVSPITYYPYLLDANINGMILLRGGAFFGGIGELLDIVLKNIVNYDYIFPFQQLINETSTFLRINSDHYYNAFPTMLYYFYRDGRFLGIVLDSLLFSIITSHTYRAFKTKWSTKGESLYLLSLYLIVMGTLRWEPVMANFWITLLSISFFTSNSFLKRLEKKKVF